jgi:hypothetical protein
MPHEPSRRAVLGGVAAAALALPRGARALGAATRFDVAELVLGAGTLSRPAAWERLLFETIQSTSVECEPRAVALSPEDPALFAHPFCVLVGAGALPPLSDAAVEQLRRYLTYGGFLLLDDASGAPGGAFARSARALATRLFPTRPLSPLPADHSVFRAFFLLGRALGRVDLDAPLEGVSYGSTTPLFYMPNDLSGALDRLPDGRDRQPCVPGGEHQRREALKLGINLVLYSLTSNYKHDQAHVAALLRQGKLE